MPEEDEFEPDERKPGTGRFQKVHKEQSFHSGVQLGEQGFKFKASSEGHLLKFTAKKSDKKSLRI